MLDVALYLLTKLLLAVNYLTTVLNKDNSVPGFNLTMMFEWTVERAPESTVALKRVSGVSQIQILSKKDRGNSTSV